MYKQSIQNIKVVIIPLDGIILDLNRFRYNYYHRLCKDYHISLDKYDFYCQLSNMYDMYKNLPLQKVLDSGVLNAQIERELFQYLKYSGVKAKEGIYELIEYFHQKEIKIAIISTHHTKNAIEYLKLVNLYNKVHFIIGSDSKCLPIPSTQMLETISNHFQAESKDVLVISPFLSLNKAACQTYMNVIYCKDLYDGGDLEKQTSYKCVASIFEVLNTLLFDKYEEKEMYSSILGMDNYMSKDDLDEKYIKLKETYNGDDDILQVIDQTYHYHISQLDEHHIKDGSLVQSSYKRFTFADEDDENIVSSRREKMTRLNEEKIKPVSFNENTYQDEEDKELFEILKQIQKKEKAVKENDEFDFNHFNKKVKEIKTQNIENSEHTSIKTLDKEEENELKSLLENIEKNEETIIEKKNNIFLEEIEDEEEEENLFVFIVSEIISTILISLSLIFVGIVLSVLLIHQWDQGGFFDVILSLYHGYYSIVESCFAFILDTLHSLLEYIPSYDQYYMNNPMFSKKGVEILNMFIFNTIIIGIIRIPLIIRGRKINDRED